MIKKVYFTVLFTAISFVSICQQENEFVEVIVQDTIHLAADRILFNLVIKKDEEISYLKVASNQSKATVQDRREETIRNIIEKQKIDTIPDDEHPILKEPLLEGIKKTFSLRFNSPQQFNRFIKEAGRINNISGNIVSKKSDKESSYRELLTKKLLETALIEATYIAGQSKKSVGKLIQVKDDDMSAEGGAAGWTSYPPLSALYGFYGTEYQTTIVLQRRLRVRYLWQ